MDEVNRNFVPISFLGTDTLNTKSFSKWKESR